MIILITNFFKNHMVLSLYFLTALIIYIFFEILVYFNEKKQKYKISCNQLTILFNHNKALIIDIRSQEDYNKSHIVGSINIPSPSCNAQHNLIKSAIGSRPIVIVDTYGKEAIHSVTNFRKSNVQDIWYLQGGIINWKQQGLPLTSIPGSVNKSLANIVIYTKDGCPYCVSAKNLLRSKNYSYQEIKIVDFESKEYKHMLTLSNGLKTVPQIFINNQHIGGFDDLKELNDKGELVKVIETV